MRDPLTGQQFPDNQIPASRIDPIAATILGYVPLPQTAAATNNFLYNSPRNQDAQKGDVRIDQILGNRQNFYVRYSFQRTEDGLSPPLPPDADGNIYSGGGAETSKSKSWVAVHNYVLSPRLISAIRVGANSIAWASEIPDQSLRGIGIPGVAEVAPGFSQAAVTGFPSCGVTNTPHYDTSTNRPFSADLACSRERSCLKSRLPGELARDLLPELAALVRTVHIQRAVHRVRRSPLSPGCLGVLSQSAELVHAFFSAERQAVTRGSRHAGVRMS